MSTEELNRIFDKIAITQSEIFVLQKRNEEQMAKHEAQSAKYEAQAAKYEAK